MGKAIAYYRVSTQKQGNSGLGLEAQESAVSRYASAQNLEVVASYTELETGTRKRERTQIHEAIGQAKSEGAVLLIAKLDRLSRNLHFVSGLLEAGVSFVAVDMPHANNLTIQLMAVMAEHEAQAISVRTREALAAAKARGVKLGSPKGMTEETRAKGRNVIKERAKIDYAPIRGYVSLMREQKMSYRMIAQRLNAEGIKTRMGKEWKPIQVSRVLAKK